MQEGAERYYREHPDRLGDERSDDAIKWSHDGMERVLEILNEYDVKLKDKQP